MENVAREVALGTSEGTYLPEDTYPHVNHGHASAL